MNQLYNYRYMMGLIIMVAIAFTVVTNWQSLFRMVGTVYDAVLPLLVGAAIAFVLDIIVNRYEKLYFPSSRYTWMIATRRPVCIVGAIFSIVFLIALVLYLAIPQTVHSIALAISYLPYLYDTLVGTFTHVAQQASFVDQRMVDDVITGKKLLNSVTEYGARWASSAANVLGNLIYFVVNAVVGFVFSIYLLLNKAELAQEGQDLLRAYCTETTQGRILHVGRTINSTFRSFFIGQFLDALILGTLVGLAMMLFQLPFALNIACVVGVTALVPLIGAYIGATVGVVMLLMDSPLNAVLFLVILVIMQQVENNFIYPKVVGDSIGLPGIWVFAAIIVGANLSGVVGILLAVPIAATAYRLLREDVEQRIARK